MTLFRGNFSLTPLVDETIVVHLLPLYTSKPKKTKEKASNVPSTICTTLFLAQCISIIVEMFLRAITEALAPPKKLTPGQETKLLARNAAILQEKEKREWRSILLTTRCVIPHRGWHPQRFFHQCTQACIQNLLSS
jgi:hypothetical protein